MNAQRIYRTFRWYALDLASTHDVSSETALLALARAASQCPPNLAQAKVARWVHAQTEQSIVQSKQNRRLLRATG